MLDFQLHRSIFPVFFCTPQSLLIRPRAETLANIQKPSNSQDVDHRIQKYAQWDMLYLGIYRRWVIFWMGIIRGISRYSDDLPVCLDLSGKIEIATQFSWARFVYLSMEKHTHSLSYCWCSFHPGQSHMLKRAVDSCWLTRQCTQFCHTAPSGCASCERLPSASRVSSSSRHRLPMQGTAGLAGKGLELDDRRRSTGLYWQSHDTTKLINKQNIWHPGRNKGDCTGVSNVQLTADNNILDHAWTKFFLGRGIAPPPASITVGVGKSTYVHDGRHLKEYSKRHWSYQVYNNFVPIKERLVFSQYMTEDKMEEEEEEESKKERHQHQSWTVILTSSLVVVIAWSHWRASHAIHGR